MKKFLFLLFAALAACFISCDREPVKEKVNYKGSWKVMCEFISNNYTEGDSLVFYNESLNVLDTFVVSYTGAMLMKQANDTNYTDNEELGYIVYDTIAFMGDCGDTNKTFVLYLDDERNGAKKYNVYFKQLEGTGKLVLTTQKAGATDLTLDGGTYVTSIYVDTEGNIYKQE